MGSEEKQGIVSNTLILYIRMLFVMIVTLYISRLLLQSLGVEDFGIYNVVGGVVLMFSFLNAAMSSSTQRFLSYEIGRNDFANLKAVFITSFTIHLLIGGIVLLLAETVGLWFLNSKMTIPPDRMYAANWVYQFAILSFVISVIQVPFNACVIAHEHMKIYAYISIAEVALRLFFVLLLVHMAGDKLILYAFFCWLIIVCITGFYVVCCHRRYEECKFRFVWYKPLFSTMSSYACWSLYGSAASMLYFQGINILLNIFFGPVVNAARAIAFQINTAIYAFTANFQMAVNPQIVKKYAAKEFSSVMSLVFISSKLSFFLLYFISLPILFELNFILGIWLNVVPEYTAVFTKLIIINALVDCISNPLMILAQATGRIRKYQFFVGSILLLNLPVSYLFMKLGYTPQFTMYVSIGLSFVALFARLEMLKKMTGFEIKKFILFVCVRCFLVGCICLIPPLVITSMIDDSVGRLFLVLFTSSFVTLLVYWTVGLTKNERMGLIEKIKIRYSTYF